MAFLGPLAGFQPTSLAHVTLRPSRGRSCGFQATSVTYSTAAPPNLSWRPNATNQGPFVKMPPSDSKADFVGVTSALRCAELSILFGFVLPEWIMATDRAPWICDPDFKPPTTSRRDDDSWEHLHLAEMVISAGGVVLLDDLDRVFTTTRHVAKHFPRSAETEAEWRRLNRRRRTLENARELVILLCKIIAETVPDHRREYLRAELLETWKSAEFSCAILGETYR